MLHIYAPIVSETNSTMYFPVLRSTPVGVFVTLIYQHFGGVRNGCVRVELFERGGLQMFGQSLTRQQDQQIGTLTSLHQ